MSKKRKILIVSDSELTSGVKSLTREAKSRDLLVDVIRPSSLIPMISDSTGYDRFYTQSVSGLKRFSTQEYEFAVIRLGTNLRYGAMVVDQLRLNSGLLTSATGLGLLNAANKYQTTQLCGAWGLPTPKTILPQMGAKLRAKDIVAQLEGLPLIIKQIGGSKGAGVAIVDSEISLQSNLESYQKAGVGIVLQQYIDANGKDIRAFIVGDSVVAAYERTSPKNDFRANISLGGKGRKFDLDEPQKIMCLKAAKAVGLQICGVDLIRDSQGKNYVVEVNGNPGFHIEGITGVNVSGQILDYMVQQTLTFRKDQKERKDQIRGLEGIISAQAEENLRLKYYLKPIQESVYFKDLAKRVQGKHVDYVDRHGNKKKKLIRNHRDLLMIISETFKIE